MARYNERLILTPRDYRAIGGVNGLASSKYRNIGATAPQVLNAIQRLATSNIGNKSSTSSSSKTSSKTSSKSGSNSSYTSYIQQGVQNLNPGHDYTIQQLITQLGGLTNPTEDVYDQAEYRDVTDPQLRTVTEYLNQLGATGYQYQYDDILKGLNDATNAAYDARYNSLADANAEFNRNMATQQESVADTIRGQYAQSIQNGVSRGMQSANVLSSILGTSQAAAQGAQQLAQDRYQTGMDKQAQLIKDASDALSKSNSAYETLMGNIRQLYNDEIQEKTADLEYNASIAETNANYLASLYNSDTNYAQGVLNNAAGIYNNNQSALSSIIAAAAGASAQDGYSNAYLEAAQAAADATKYAADQSYAATKYATDNSSSSKQSTYRTAVQQSSGGGGTPTTPQSSTQSAITKGLNARGFTIPGSSTNPTSTTKTTFNSLFTPGGQINTAKVPAPGSVNNTTTSNNSTKKKKTSGAGGTSGVGVSKKHLVATFKR